MILFRNESVLVNVIPLQKKNLIDYKYNYWFANYIICFLLFYWFIDEFFWI